jgi:multiple sugar transport system substrate-binding protein
MPCRVSQLAAAEPWFGHDTDRAERARLGALVERVFSHDSCLVVPRIPGIDEYLAALEEAVTSVIHKKLAPGEALAHASQEWDSITDRLDREKQRQAYRRHLNLSD